jgi:hypothetical protein
VFSDGSKKKNSIRSMPPGFTINIMERNTFLQNLLQKEIGDIQMKIKKERKNTTKRIRSPSTN